ncbi:MAG: CCA tRNA nucleotidyltransferase [Candidatus Heimdallarchaeaceae archaeon]
MQKQEKEIEKCLSELKKYNLSPKVYAVPEQMIERVEPRVRTVIKKVYEIADTLNISICLVGGFVRDLLLANPSQDVDFVVYQGDINQLTETIANKETAKIGKMNNKTLTTQVRFRNGIICEFNSTRKEKYEYPSRTPIVEKANLAEDLLRRDFTINSLLMIGNKVVDCFKGKEDIENSIIRTVREPEIVFKEDYLRMFRAIRFAAKLNFKIENQVKKGIMENANNILDVPVERIIAEMKLALSLNPVLTFKLMDELKLLKVLIPNLKNCTLSEEEYKYETLFEKIVAELEFLKEKNVSNSSVLLAVLLKEIQIEDAELFDPSKLELLKIEEIKQFLRSYKFSNNESKEILTYVKNIKIIPQMRVYTSSVLEKRYFLQSVSPYLENLILLTEAENLTHKLPFDLESQYEDLIQLNSNKELIFVTPALNGKEIQEIFGFKNAEIAEIKLILTVAIMKEEIKNTKEECIKYINRYIKEKEK